MKRAVRRAVLTVAGLAVLGTPSPSEASWLEARKLLGSDTSTNDLLGEAMALDGDRLAVGAWREDAPFTDTGAVYVFERNAGGPERWGEVAKLVASDPASALNLGYKVALDGDRIAAAAPAFEPSPRSVYLFERQSDGQWLEIRRLMEPPDPKSSSFALSVAVAGDTVFVGSCYELLASCEGAVWVYERDAGGPGNWGLVQRLTAAQWTSDARFGSAVAAEGGILAVGAFRDRDTGGAVHVFEKDGSGAWLEVVKLLASDGAGGDDLGESVAISGATVVAGAPANSGNTGAAYVFERDESGVWTEVVKLTASDTDGGDAFGRAVGVSGDLVIVGAELDEMPGVASGAAFLFQRQADGNWIEVAKLEASDAADGDTFGHSVAAGVQTAVVGAEGNDEAGFNAGSAYVFVERAVELGVTGSCPGEATLTVTGATAAAPVAVLLGAEGMSTLPRGPCQGTELGLAQPRLAGAALTDRTGTAAVTRTLGSGVCGLASQALDLATCALSNVAGLP